MRNTPGALGYSLAVLVSLVAFCILMAIPQGGWKQLPVAVFMIAVFGCYLWLPVALVGVATTHLVARHSPHQWVHVLVAGLAGAAAGLALGSLLDVYDLTLRLGIATAIGRAAVVPLVPAHPPRPAHAR